MKRLLIDAAGEAVRTARTDGDKLTELQIDHKAEGSIVGRVVRGIVENILHQQFAFINIGQEKNAFMNLNAETAVKIGQPVTVQVYKDASGTKGAHVGALLNFNGRLAILMDSATQEIGVSHKIADKRERARLRGIARQAIPAGCGAIIRTNALGKPEAEIQSDIARLAELRQKVSERARYAKPPCVLYDGNPLLNDLLADDIAEILVNEPKQFEAVREAVCINAPAMADRVVYYDEALHPPLFQAWGIEKQIARALQRKVWLPCGGYVTIEETEACVIIDVNTGKFAGKKAYRETVLQTNLEAAVCIAEQMTLRNLSGMIIVDFIDMHPDEDKKTLLKTLTAAIQKDRIKTDIVGMTALGLIQLTRRKTREPLSRLLEKECPHCRGKGRVCSYTRDGKLLPKIF